MSNISFAFIVLCACGTRWCRNGHIARKTGFPVVRLQLPQTGTCKLLSPKCPGYSFCFVPTVHDGVAGRNCQVGKQELNLECYTRTMRHAAALHNACADFLIMSQGIDLM